MEVLVRLTIEDKQKAARLQGVKVAGIDLEIFVDGSFDPAMKRGGWAFVSYQRSIAVFHATGYVDGGDSTAMELTALIEALRWASNVIDVAYVSIWSDSAYLVDGCNKWRTIWRNSKWRRRKPNGVGRNRSVPYAELWRDIDTLLIQRPETSISWCKGHSTTLGNLRADELAGFARSDRRNI